VRCFNKSCKSVCYSCGELLEGNDFEDADGNKYCLKCQDEGKAIFDGEYDGE
jgi:hypothetical protein